MEGDKENLVTVNRRDSNLRRPPLAQLVTSAVRNPKNSASTSTQPVKEKLPKKESLSFLQKVKCASNTGDDKNEIEDPDEDQESPPDSHGTCPADEREAKADTSPVKKQNIIVREGNFQGGKPREGSLEVYEYLQESVQLQIKLETDKMFNELPISTEMHMLLVDWLTLLTMNCNSRSTTLHLAMRILNRVLLKPVHGKDLQLLCLAAFRIAHKADVASLRLTNKDLFKMYQFKRSVNDHTRCPLMSAEFFVLRSIDYKLDMFDDATSITTYHILKLGLDGSHLGRKLRYMVKFLLDVSLLSWDIFFCRSSHVASAATLCALTLLDLTDYVQPNDRRNNDCYDFVTLSASDAAFVAMSDVRDIMNTLYDLLLMVQSVKARRAASLKHEKLLTMFRGVLAKECIVKAQNLLSY